MRKIRIMHVVQAAGGVDRYIRMLLKYLDKEKFENILICSQDFHKADYDGLVDCFEQIEMNRAIGMSEFEVYQRSSEFDEKNIILTLFMLIPVRLARLLVLRILD